MSLTPWLISLSIILSSSLHAVARVGAPSFFLLHSTPLFIAAQFTIAKCWKQPNYPSVNEWMEKLWYIYTVEYYPAERKKELLPFATVWMDLEIIMLSEISQSEKDKYHMISPLSGT